MTPLPLLLWMYKALDERFFGAHYTFAIIKSVWNDAMSNPHVSVYVIFSNNSIAGNSL